MISLLVSLLAAAPTAPRLSVMAGAPDGLPIGSGWPIIVVARFTSSTAFTREKSGDTLLAGPGDQPWTQSVSFTANGPGITPSIVFTPATTGAQKTAVVDTNRYAVVVWFLPPDRAAQLKPGSYTFTVRYDGSKTSTTTAFHGSVQATASVQIVASPPEAAERSALATADYDELTGKPDAALQSIDKFLAGNAHTARTMERKGDLLVQKKQLKDALAAYEEAVSLLRNAEEPPSRLMRKLRRVDALLSKKG